MIEKGTNYYLRNDKLRESKKLPFEHSAEEIAELLYGKLERELYHRIGDTVNAGPIDKIAETLSKMIVGLHVGSHYFRFRLDLVEHEKLTHTTKRVRQNDDN